MSNIWEGKWITNFSESLKPNAGATAYRYADRQGTDFSAPDECGDCHPTNTYVEIILESYPVLRYTPKGFWIDNHGKEKFIAHHWRKKWAQLNLAEARHAFQKRKELQQKILTKQLENIDRVLYAIKDDQWSGRCAHSAFKLKRVLA